MPWHFWTREPGSTPKSLWARSDDRKLPSWSSIITRGLMMEFAHDSQLQGLVGMFFVSYVLVVGLVLMNIVVGESLLMTR